MIQFGISLLVLRFFVLPIQHSILDLANMFFCHAIVVLPIRWSSPSAMLRPLVTSTVFGCLLAAPGVDQRSRSKRQTEVSQNHNYVAVGAFWKPSLSSLLLRGQASALITSTLGSTASQSTSATTTGSSGPLHKASLTPGTVCKSWTCLLYTSPSPRD